MHLRRRSPAQLTRPRISPQTSKRSTALGRSPPIASQKMPKKLARLLFQCEAAEVLENWRPGRWSTRSLRTEAACHCVPVLINKMRTFAPYRPRLGCLSPRPSRASVSEDASSASIKEWPDPLSCAAAKGRGLLLGGQGARQRRTRSASWNVTQGRVRRSSRLQEIR